MAARASVVNNLVSLINIIVVLIIKYFIIYNTCKCKDNAKYTKSKTLYTKKYGHPGFQATKKNEKEYQK